MKCFILSAIILLFFCGELLASEKNNLIKQYNGALVLFEKENYAQAQLKLEDILLSPSILIKEKSSLVRIKLYSLFALAKLYNQLAMIALQSKEKNFDLTEIYLKNAIRIYQKILTEKFIKKDKFTEIFSSAKHNLEYSKLELFKALSQQEALFFKTNQQKKIPILIQELAKEEQQTLKKIKELEFSVKNFASQKKKDKLAKKQIKIQKKFFILQKKIKQAPTDPLTNL